MQMLVMRSRRNMQRKPHNRRVFQDIDQGHLPHIPVTRVIVIGQVYGQDENEEHDRQYIARDLDELVGEEGEPDQYKRYTHDIGPGDTPDQGEGNVDQQVAGVEEVEDTKDDKYHRQDVDGNP